MASPFPISTREPRLALALLVSLLLPMGAAAADYSGDYRVRDQVLSSGVRMVQRVDRTAFPSFEGERPGASSPDAPAVEAGHVRAVRALLARKSDDSLALALPDGSAYLAVDFYNHHVAVEYGSTPAGQSVNPFGTADEESKSEGDEQHRWSQVISIGGKPSSSVTHFLATLYVVPHLDGQSRQERAPNVVLTIHEATLQGMNVVRGRSLAGNVLLAVDEAQWKRWSEQPIRAGIIPDMRKRPLSLPADFAGGLPFVDQRTLGLSGDASTRRRDKRCLTDAFYLASNLLLPALLEMYFGRSDLCSLDPHPNQDIERALPFVEVADRENAPRFAEATVLESTASDSAELGAPAAFDAAMDVQFCNENHPEAAAEDACGDEDHRAIAAIGRLSPQQIDELLAAIARMYEPDQPGTATLRTGDGELDRWLNADLVRAENALSAAQAIVHVSDTQGAPNEPIKNKKKKKRKLLKATCNETKEDEHDSVDPFQECVRKAKRRARETDAVVALTPHIATNERYRQRGTPQFERLVRELRNTGRPMPAGISEAQFSQFTAAIARDSASTGDNLGFVFINDPTLRNGTARFRYGVEHIWAPGAGGGDNAGHRDDWQALGGLPVNNRDTLVRIIMAALTDPNARFTQSRTRNGNVVRTFHYFTFIDGDMPFAIRNVRIVLAQNGMVVTAYPLRGATAERLDM